MSTNTISKAQKFVFNNAVRGLVDSSVFTGAQATGVFGPSTISVNENGTASFIFLGEPDGTFYYWIEPVAGTVNSSDFTSGWADSSNRSAFEVSGGVGTFSLTLSSDVAAEGTETFRVKVSKDSSGAEFAQSAIVTINDTSVPTSQAQGTTSGYTSGGARLGTYRNEIDKYPFSSDTNAVDVGDLTEPKTSLSGQSSSTYGYISGGFRVPGVPAYINVIEKFPFASDGTAVDVGDLTEERRWTAGQSSSAYGYVSGGSNPNLPTPGYQNIIDRFPFSSDTNASDVGDLTEFRGFIAGQSSTTHGYTSGGLNPGLPTPNLNTIDKFPFASNNNASDVGDLSVARWGPPGGQNSYTHGYASGGLRESNPSNIIDKFPFSSDTNAVDVGDLTEARRGPVGQSSGTHGYSSGGNYPHGLVIDKFPFSSDGNATDVGDLVFLGRYGGAGQQY